MADHEHFSVGVFLPSERTARIQEAGRVAAMVDALPGAIHDESLSPLAQQACLEAFFVHVRGLLEFLEVRKGDSTRDFSATDVLPNWKPKIDASEDHLRRYWDIASSQLMHFSRRRVKQDNSPAVTIDTGKEAIRAVADDVLEVWDQFAGKLGHPLAPMRGDFTLFSDKRDMRNT
jgi:hypothetical protein